MKSILVWDIPIRLFHWGFAVSVSAALGIAFLVDDDAPLFQLHMLFGLVAVFLVVVRLVLGFAGSRHARFSSFPLHPREVFSYFRDSIRAKTRRYPGNNPGSAVAALFMFLLVPALALTGTDWTGRAREDAHELAAWALLAVVSLHMIGIAWHTLRHRENIAVSMVTGKKHGQDEDGIPSANGLPGFVLFLLCAAWIFALFSSHQPDASTVRLPVLGLSVSLGENESGENKATRKSRDRSHRHDDDD